MYNEAKGGGGSTGSTAILNQSLKYFLHTDINFVIYFIFGITNER